MSEPTQMNLRASSRRNELIGLADEIETALSGGNYEAAAQALERDILASWFAFPPTRTVEIIQLLATKLSSLSPFLQIALRIFTDDTPGALDCPQFLSSVNLQNPKEMFILSILRLADFRLKGRTHDGLLQSLATENHVWRMQPWPDSYHGRALPTAVQTGVSAMLPGDFTRALTNFTRAQMHVPVPNFSFLTRDALVKSALLHACFV